MQIRSNGGNDISGNKEIRNCRRDTSDEKRTDCSIWSDTRRNYKRDDMIDGRSGAEKKEVTSRVDKEADLSSLERLKERFKKLQEQYEPFNP